MTYYRVWAPYAKSLELVYAPSGERVPLSRGERDHFEIDESRFDAGTRYAFSIDGGPPRPDPRSRFQPEGVHGPSEWVNLEDFAWSDSSFQQVPLASALVYELHVGTFSPEGTFDGVLPRLPHLKDLGVTHVELMPVAAFPGNRGWGYDGVSLFAPHAAYDGPQGLMRLVDGCHRAGLAVLLDVVYNHLGPSGNYLGQFGPYFTDRYVTPWGQAVNFDGPGSDPVRRFVCDNALHWLRHYHIDGLRLDAVHAIFDQSATHVLEQLSSEVDALSVELGKYFILVAESHLNDPRFVKSRELGGLGLSSQWNDDFHHALRTVLTEEKTGYYADFGRISDLAEALRFGFAYRGRYSEHRQHSYGRDSTGLEGRQFHVFNQNHDQVGNRAMGDRLAAELSTGALKVAATLTLLSPFVPMLFMGEEWGAGTPFQYFTSHAEADLAEAVRQGRRREFAAFGWDPESIPDPQAEATFLASKLDWQERDAEPHRELFDWYRELWALRRREPDLKSDRLENVRTAFDESERWLILRRSSIVIFVNFSREMRSLDRAHVPGEVANLELLSKSEPEVELSDASILLPPSSVAIAIDER